MDAIAPAFAPGDVIELRALDPTGGGGMSFVDGSTTRPSGPRW